MLLLSQLRGLAAKVLGFSKPLPVDATAASGSTSFAYDELPNPDPILAEHPSERRTYYARARRQIAFVAGIAKLRIDAVRSVAANWLPGQQDDERSRRRCQMFAAAYDAMEGQDATERHLLMSIMDGVKLARYAEWGEFTYRFSDGTSETILCPRRIVDWPDALWTFNRDGKPTLVDNNGRVGRVLDPFECVIARYGSALEWGRGDQQDVSNEMWMYDQINKMGLVAMKKQGFPLQKVTYPSDWGSGPLYRNLLRAVAASYPNYLLIPYGDRVEFLPIDSESSPTFLGSDQLQRQTAIKNDISVGLLGVSFSNTEQGSFARDKVRDNLRYEKTEGDVVVRNQIRDDWAQKTHAVNWPDEPQSLCPQAHSDTEPNEDLKGWTENASAFVDRGLEVSKKQVREKLQLAPPEGLENESDVLAKVATVGQAAAPEPEADETTAVSESVTVPAGASTDAGITAAISLNGAQIDGVLTAIESLRKGAIGPISAKALIKGSGISEDEAAAMVAEATGLGEIAPAPVPPPFQRPQPDPLTVMSETGKLFEIGAFDEAAQTLQLIPKE